MSFESNKSWRAQRTLIFFLLNVMVGLVMRDPLCTLPVCSNFPIKICSKTETLAEIALDTAYACRFVLQIVRLDMRKKTQQTHLKQILR